MKILDYIFYGSFFICLTLGLIITILLMVLIFPIWLPIAYYKYENTSTR